MSDAKGLDAYRFAQAAIEVRYDKTHRYWDESGKVIAALESRLSGITCDRLGPTGFEFSAPVDVGFTAATFYWDRIAVTCTAPDSPVIPKRFSENASEFCRLAAYCLGVQGIKRVGHRLWHYLPFTETTGAVDWLQRQQLWNPDPTLEKWGKPSNEILRLQFAIEGDRSVVLRVGSGIMQFGGKTTPGVFVDTDFFISKSMSASALDLEGFVKSNVRYLDQRIGSLMNGGR